jgi:thioesterase domain-containing protein
MNELSSTFVYLPGAGGGGEGDLAALVAGLGYPVFFESIRYPDWQRCVEEDFSAESILEEVTAEISKRVPVGPIRIMGMSLGGHLGYAAALRLQEQGREIVGLCVVDAFMIETTQPTTGWQGRALAQGMDLLRKRRFMDLLRFARSKTWRALLRLAGGRLVKPLRKLSTSGGLNSLLATDAVAEEELSMRLLLRHLAPWLAQLDREPAPLIAPVALLRTPLSADDDTAWMRRCPYISIHEVPGTHQTLFEAEHIGTLRDAFGAAMGEFEQASSSSLEIHTNS